MVCGGAISGTYSAATWGRYLNGLKSCGRMVITGNENEWKMEEMLDLHVLNEMLVLPTGNFLIINRWKQGCAGYNSTKSFPPTLTFTNRKEDQEEGFQSLHPQQSQECILHSPWREGSSGRGNLHSRYTFNNVGYPTELRLQAFLPYHMDRQFAGFESKVSNIGRYVTGFIWKLRFRYLCMHCMILPDKYHQYSYNPDAVI